MKSLTGDTGVPAIDLNGEIVKGWGPQSGQKVLDMIAKSKGQAGGT